MNILHFIVVAILAGAGYLLHGPLIGQKGIFADLVRPSDEAIVKNENPVKQDPVTDTSTDPEKPSTGGGSEDPKMPERDDVFTLDKLLPEDFPKMCKMERSGFASIPGGTLPLDIGDQLKPLAVRGNDLEVVVVKLGVTGTVPVGTTDFIKLALPRYMARKSGKTPPVAGGGGTTPRVDPKPDPKPDPVVVKPDPQPKPDPVDPNPKPDPKPAITKLSDADVKKLMQSGYKKVGVLNTSQLTGVEVTGVETIDDVQYQTGVLKFKRDTLLGVRELSAKALIRDGKLERWVWTKSGQTIR